MAWNVIWWRRCCWQVVGRDIRGTRREWTDVLGSSVGRPRAGQHRLCTGHTEHGLSDHGLQQSSQEDIRHSSRPARSVIANHVNSLLDSYLNYNVLTL